MARKKAAHKKHHPHRRRRISGVGHGVQNDLMEAAGIVIGSVVATVAQRQLTSVNPKIVSGMELVGGIMLKRHARTPLMTGMSYGFMGAGAIGLTHEVGLIHGLDDMVSGLMHPGAYSEELNMHGLDNSSHVNSFAGINNSARVAGDGLAMSSDNIPPVGY